MGEIAEEMYFLKKGQVEIIASDGKTRIAVLKEGSYFGEIGLLLGVKRTVYVKALHMCVLLAIEKNDLEYVLESYPEMRRFLKKVSKQRMKTTHRSDIVSLLDRVSTKSSDHSMMKRALVRFKLS